MSIADRLLEIMDIEVEYHSGTNEYEDGVIRLSYFEGNVIGNVIKTVMGRSIEENNSLYHEIGHAIADVYNVGRYKETKRLFGDFNEEYHGTPMLILSMSIADHEDYVTSYAQTHPEEDWADTVAYVLQNYSSLRKRNPQTVLEKKIYYVKQWIDEILEEE